MNIIKGVYSKNIQSSRDFELLILENAVDSYMGIDLTLLSLEEKQNLSSEIDRHMLFMKPFVKSGFRKFLKSKMTITKESKL